MTDVSSAEAEPAEAEIAQARLAETEAAQASPTQTPAAASPFAIPAISADDPCGPDLDLEGDPDYLNFLAATEGLLPSNYYTFNRETIDFPGTLKTIGALLERTLDIRLLILGAKLAILNRDFEGFAARIGSVAWLLETYWDEAHPRAESGDFALRVGQLEMLDDNAVVLLPLQYAPIVDASRLGKLSYRDHLVATGAAEARVVTVFNVKGEKQTTAPEEFMAQGAIDRLLRDVEIEKLVGAYKTARGLAGSVEFDPHDDEGARRRHGAGQHRKAQWPGQGHRRVAAGGGGGARSNACSRRRSRGRDRKGGRRRRGAGDLRCGSGRSGRVRNARRHRRGARGRTRLFPARGADQPGGLAHPPGPPNSGQEPLRGDAASGAEAGRRSAGVRRPERDLSGAGAQSCRRADAERRARRGGAGGKPSGGDRDARRGRPAHAEDTAFEPGSYLLERVKALATRDFVSLLSDILTEDEVNSLRKP